MPKPLVLKFADAEIPCQLSRVERSDLPADEVPARLVTLERPGLTALAEWGYVDPPPPG